ncbi:hypothetical protein DMH17_00960 [Raoultella planticola]|nr:hypothetical protein [Raoultella planticola]
MVRVDTPVGYWVVPPDAASGCQQVRPRAAYHRAGRGPTLFIDPLARADLPSSCRSCRSRRCCVS